jgi:hypothetical protein
MSELERKANLFGKYIQGKFDRQHRCAFHCIVSPSGQICQIQAKRGGEVITKQTIPWSKLEDVRVDKMSDYGKTVLTQIGLLLDFAAV